MRSHEHHVRTRRHSPTGSATGAHTGVSAHPPATAHAHTRIYTRRHTHSYTLRAAQLRVSPENHPHVCSLLHIPHMHPCKQQMHMHTHQLTKESSHTWTHFTPLQTGVFTPMHLHGCRAASRHLYSVTPMQVTVGMPTAIGTASHTTDTCHCPCADSGISAVTLRATPLAVLPHGPHSIHVC